MHASIAKLFVSESLVTGAIDTLHVFGGYGLMEDYGIESIVLDSVAGIIYSGTSDIQRNIVARWLGLFYFGKVRRADRNEQYSVKRRDFRLRAAWL